MKIGIDLDWTLADHFGYWGKMFAGVGRTTIMWLVDYGHPFFRELVHKLWYVHTPFLTDRAWVDVVRQLRDRHRVYVVTNREEHERPPIEKWLRANNIYVDGVICVGVDGDKGEVGLDVLVDDTLSKCYDVQKRGGHAYWWLRGLVERKTLSQNIVASIAPIKPVFSAWEFYEDVSFWGDNNP
ncbi:MAG: hypothetical protein QXN23_05775 [Candidatus Caldarchaeum sp.]